MKQKDKKINGESQLEQAFRIFIDEWDDKKPVEQTTRSVNVDQRVILQRAGKLRDKYPEISEWICRDALVRQWYELYIRSDKDLTDGIMMLAKILLDAKNNCFDELLKLHITRTFSPLSK